MHKSIFVSSTFRDFQTERNLIQNRVELRVNERLDAVRVSFVDLRWGIDTTDESGLDKVVAICIEEVLNSYPYYIIMLGDSYGSCVDPDVTRTLYALNELDYDGEEKSVTEIEIEATGLFRGNRDYVLVLDRRTGGEASPRARALKEKVLSAALPKNVFRYNARLNDRSEAVLEDEKAFVEFLSNRLVAFLEQESATEMSLEEATVREEIAHFTGREAQLEQLLAKMTETREMPFFKLYGRHGTGRTAMMAKLYSMINLRENVCAAFVTDCDDGLRLPYHAVMGRVAEQLGKPGAAPHVLFRSLDPDKRYCIFVDDFADFDQIWFLQNLLRRRYIRENVTLMLWTEDPEKADAILDPLTREDALGIFRKTLAAYKKQIPTAFYDYFAQYIPEEMIQSPVYLKYFVASLCYLEEDEYLALGRSPQFMEALTQLFIRKTDCFPKTEAEYVDRVLCGGKETDRWLLGLLAVSQFGIEEKELIGVLRSGDIPCEPADFYRLKEKLREGIRRGDNNGFVLSHKVLRRGVLESFTREELLWLRYLYTAYLGQNQVRLTLPGGFCEAAYQYMEAGDPELLAALIEINQIMPDQSTKNGLLFADLCRNHGADRPSEWMLRLVEQKKPLVCEWLCHYAMPFLTELYCRNAEEMFQSMHGTVLTSGRKNNTTDDIFALYLKSLSMNLKFQEVRRLVTQMQDGGHLYSIHCSVILELIRGCCYNYQSKAAGDYLEIALTKMDRSAPGLMTFLRDVLYCVCLMDADMMGMKESLCHLFDILREELPKCRDSQHVPAIAVAMDYIQEISGLETGLTKAELEAYYMVDETFENTLAYQLLKGHVLSFRDPNSGEARQQVELICNYIEEDLPIGTTDLFYLCRFFRRVCYDNPKLFERDVAAEAGLQLFERLLALSNPINTSVQLVELAYLCYLGNLMGHGTKLEKPAKEALLTLIAAAGRHGKELMLELEYFEEDTALLQTWLGQDAQRVLRRLRMIVQRHTEN